MKTSVASVTFRHKSICEISQLASRAGLDGIEWGGDIHVPPGNRAAARQALKFTRENGLVVSAYGSYYRAEQGEEFEPVLETALLLECRIIRVWAGSRASADQAPHERSAIAARLALAVRLASQEGCVVATEYHAATLTDTLQSAAALLDETVGLHTLWQPPIGLSFEENITALHTLQGKIENLHVYHCDIVGECRPLAEGADDWRAYFDCASQDGADRFATLEFVKDNSEEQFLLDATSLLALR